MPFTTQTFMKLVSSCPQYKETNKIGNNPNFEYFHLYSHPSFLLLLDDAVVQYNTIQTLKLVIFFKLK